MLPSLPVSTWYGTIRLYMSADIFNFAAITEQFLLKWIEFIFTKSMLLSSALPRAVSCSTSFMDLAVLLLHTALKWLILLHSVHFFPWDRHCLRDGFYHNIYSLFCRHCCLCTLSSRAVLVCILCYFYFIKLFCLSEVVHDGRLGSLDPYSFSPAQHIFTSYFCIPMYFVCSLIISLNISVSFRPWVNCSFNCLSSSL